jgi:hypothetical protein
MQERERKGSTVLQEVSPRRFEERVLWIDRQKREKGEERRRGRLGDGERTLLAEMLLLGLLVLLHSNKGQDTFEVCQDARSSLDPPVVMRSVGDRERVGKEEGTF